jgi:hypothetical protein
MIVERWAARGESYPMNEQDGKRWTESLEQREKEVLGDRVVKWKPMIMAVWTIWLI